MADRILSDDRPFPHQWSTPVVASDDVVIIGYGQTALEADARAAALLQRYEALILLTPTQRLEELSQIKGELSSGEMSEAIKALTALALARQIR